VSDPNAAVHASLQPSNDNGVTSVLCTENTHACASNSATSAFPKQMGAANYLAASFHSAYNAFPESKGIPQVHDFPMGPNHTKVSERLVKMPTGEKSSSQSKCSADSTASSKRCLTDSLHAFICGKRQSNALTVTKSDEAAVDHSDDFGAFEVNEPDHWSHFYPLKALRSGIPYHLLSLVDKLVVLEYLVDELLSVDWIAAVFSDRYTKLSRSDFLYGSKPSEADIQALRDADGDDHDDFCAVCKESGDVVCCDGCVSVYHKGCVGLSQNCDLPDIWYCPECEYNDPSSFGPLRGGQKSEVDWVFIGDFFVSNHATTFDQRRRELFESKLLAVHGFVFCHNLSDSQSPRLRKDLCFVNPPIQPVLSAKSLQEILYPLGQHFSSKWPMKQVPVTSAVIWSTDNNSDLYEHYFKKRESYDPSLYKNLYFDAPILLESIQRSKQGMAFERSVLSNVATTSKLSDCISPEMGKDRHLVKILTSSTSIFDAQQVIKSSLLNIEDDLENASLLEEFWTSREQKSPNSWKESVKHCASVCRLARLLLKLVDATHVRAFKGGWTHSAIVRSKGAEGKRLRESDIKKDKCSVQEEGLRRYWERGKLCHWTYLVAKSSIFIPGFKKALCVRKTSTKRKGIGRVPKQSSFVNENIVDSADLQTADNLVVKTKPIKESGDSEALNAPADEIGMPFDKLRNRKKLDDFIFPTSLSSALNINPSLGSQMREKMTSLSREAKQLNLREVRWPCAGKKLFDPVGYVPPSVVRRLGRTGGSIFAPFVEYFSLHEVGQVAYFHIWRKRLLQCQSYEDLIKLFRILESYLDQSVCVMITLECFRILHVDLTSCVLLLQTIRQAATFSNLCHAGGGYKANSRQILCTQRDLLTGLDFHLVEGGGDRPRWLSCLEIDLQALITERQSRISRHYRKKESKVKGNPGKLGESIVAASTSDPETQGIMQRASRVVADHIIEMKKLLLQYGKECIPKAELTKLRKVSDELLQNIFVGNFSYIGKRQRSEMITKAEQSVYGKKPVQNSSTPPTGTVTSVVHQAVVGVEPDKNAAAVRTTTSAAELAAGVAPLTTSKYSAHLPNRTNDSLGSVTSDQMALGTPCDWSKQIISQHKDFTRSVYIKYGYKILPTSEMESARQKCVKDLLAIFDVSGINYSTLQTSALIKEAENEVLHDHLNSKMGSHGNSARSVGNQTQVLRQGIPYNEEQRSFPSQVGQVNGTQERNVSMELDDGYSQSTFPVNATFAARGLVNGKRWQEQPITSFLHAASSHYASADRFLSHEQPSSFQYLPMNHPEQFPPVSTAVPAQHLRSLVAPDYGNMAGNEALMSQLWHKPSTSLPSSMYPTQFQQNGAQQHPGQYSGNTHSVGTGNWFYP
jgi:hypothetical protein